jgi:UrcA family protein
MFAIKRKVLVVCAISPALVATAVVSSLDLAIAQQTDEDMDEIVVKAPVERPRFLRGGMQEPLEQIELNRRVSYADLDLGRDADVTELRSRIETTVTDSCKKLPKMFPAPSDAGEISRCTSRPVDGAEEQVQAAIATAR